MTDKAMPQLKQLVAGLSPWRPRLMPASMHVEFVVEKNGTGTSFSEFFGCPVIIIPP
jgi:hypothetical protein